MQDELTTWEDDQEPGHWGDHRVVALAVTRHTAVCLTTLALALALALGVPGHEGKATAVPVASVHDPRHLNVINPTETSRKV